MKMIRGGKKDKYTHDKASAAACNDNACAITREVTCDVTPRDWSAPGGVVRRPRLSRVRGVHKCIFAKSIPQSIILASSIQSTKDRCPWHLQICKPVFTMAAFSRKSSLVSALC